MIKTVARYFIDFFGNDKEYQHQKEKEALLTAYTRKFNDLDAELILMDLMRFANMDASIYHSGTKPGDLEFNEGKKAVVRYILDHVQIGAIEFLAKAGKDTAVFNLKKE